MKRSDYMDILEFADEILKVELTKYQKNVLEQINNNPNSNFINNSSKCDTTLTVKITEEFLKYKRE